MAAPVKVARQQTPPELSGTFRTLPPEPTPTGAGTLRNPLAEPSEPCLRNLHQHAPELFGTLRNLPELASGTYHFTPEFSGTLPEPASGTYTSRRRNSPELSGTFRNLPEPSSGTCSCNPHRDTPELIWAEDPISLRCWGKKDSILATSSDLCEKHAGVHTFEPVSWTHEIRPGREQKPSVKHCGLFPTADLAHLKAVRAILVHFLLQKSGQRSMFCCCSWAGA